MTLYAGKPEADTVTGSTGADIFENILGADNLSGDKGSDIFKFTQAPSSGAKIDGGTDNDSSDATVTLGDGTKTGSTLSAVINYAQTDILSIESSMDLSALSFTHIEKITLSEGVELVMSSEQFEEGLASLDYESGTTELNPGLQVEGTAGGKVEKLTINVGSGANFELDDASTGFIFKDVDVTIQYEGGDVRYDGTAAAETIIGGSGTEYITARLGNDIVHAGAGNDLLIGHEGADQLYGEAGDDIFVISRIATKAGGGTFAIAKASDGSAEFVAGDLMDGGEGVDELRISAAGAAVSGTENTITLTEDNFKNIEKVTLGTPVARDAQFATVQDQMAAGAYAAVNTGKDAINVNGSALKAGVSYQGNDGDNKLLGGSGNDTFIGAKGNDLLDGGSGTDTMVLDPDSLAGLKVFLGKDQHTFLTNAAGEHDTFNSIEKVAINGQSIDIGFLAQPATNLQNIGVLSKLLFSQSPGIDALISLAPLGGDAKGLVDQVMALDGVKSVFDGMSNAQFAATLVNNGLGINDQGAVNFAQDYLNTHSKADLVLVGVQYDPIVDHAFGTDGLELM
ncbi:MAG: hypothetical protein ABL903_16430 [Methylococcales bacterium]